MLREWIKDILREKNLIGDAMKWGMTFLKSRNIYDDVDDFVYDDCNQIANIINEVECYDTDKLIESLEYYQNKANNFAKLMYSHESGWNLKLPMSMTKVMGHEYTITEWITTRAAFVAENIKFVIKDIKEGRL